jgi:hypothetical protein
MCSFVGSDVVMQKSKMLLYMGTEQWSPSYDSIQ